MNENTTVDLTLKDHPVYCAEDVPDWLNEVEAYVRETHASVLNLLLKCPSTSDHSASYSDTMDNTMDMPFDVVESLLNRLADTHVKELHLDFEEFSTISFSDLLKKSNITKLNFGDRVLTKKNLYALLDILEHTNVDVSGCFGFVSDHFMVLKDDKLVSHLVESRLTKLTLSLSTSAETSLAFMFAKGLPGSSLTSLQLSFELELSWSNIQDIAASIFSKLPLCQIKELDLSGNWHGDTLLFALSPNLAASKLETLNLSHCFITDSDLDILAAGLVGSKVSILNLSHNDIHGENNFGEFVNRTKIKVLDLEGNGIRHDQMFALPKFLAGSQVESLNISLKHFDIAFQVELLTNLRFTKITKLELYFLGENDQAILEVAAALSTTNVEHFKLDLSAKFFDLFSKLLKESKLNYIKLETNTLYDSKIIFSLDLTKNSNVSCLKLNNYVFTADVHVVAKQLVGSNITHLHLNYCELNDFVTSFVPYLKDTSITDLSFAFSKLEDEDILKLAENLKRTKISHLNLMSTGLTSVGVEALSLHIPRTSIIWLNLHDNKLKEEDFEFLAKSLSDSFLTTLYISGNLGQKFLRTQTMLFKNRVRAHKFVVFFKQVVPENGKKNFCFSQCTTDLSVNDFLLACLTFYKTVVEQPAAISVLTEEENVPFSREELTSLFDKFPLQFTQYITNEIEADISEHVELLEKAEELGLSKIVELLLLNRPLYYIDKKEEILHPRVYKLLLKYNLPVVNIDIEPTGLAKIINYFTEHFSIEGSADLINLLSGAKTS